LSFYLVAMFISKDRNSTDLLSCYSLICLFSSWHTSNYHYSDSSMWEEVACLVQNFQAVLYLLCNQNPKFFSSYSTTQNIDILVNYCILLSIASSFQTLHLVKNRRQSTTCPLSLSNYMKMTDRWLKILLFIYHKFILSRVDLTTFFDVQ